MPLKDFQCSSCGHEQEELVSLGSTDDIICNHCDSDRMVSLPSVIGGYTFKGGSGDSSRTPKDAGSPKRNKK